MLLTPVPSQPQFPEAFSKLSDCFISGFHVQTVRCNGLTGQIGLPLQQAINSRGCPHMGNKFLGDRGVNMDDQLLQIRVIEARAQFAALAQSRGDFQEAERLYLFAIRQAEATMGYYSPTAGYVLMGLHDLYESQNRDEEAAEAWERSAKSSFSEFVIFSKSGKLACPD